MCVGVLVFSSALFSFSLLLSLCCDGRSVGRSELEAGRDSAETRNELRKERSRDHVIKGSAEEGKGRHRVEPDLLGEHREKEWCFL